MSIVTDIRNVSDAVIDRLSAQFTDLPRPLLAAVGAGDVAIEHLAALRDELSGRLGVAGDVPSASGVKGLVSDLPGRAQKVVDEVTDRIQSVAQSAPEKAQHLIGELPGKATGLGHSLSPDHLRETVEAYTQLVGSIYGTLADRGDAAVTKIRGRGMPSASTHGAGTPAPASETGASPTGPASDSADPSDSAASHESASPTDTAATHPTHAAGTRSHGRTAGSATGGTARTSGSARSTGRTAPRTRTAHGRAARPADSGASETTDTAGGSESTRPTTGADGN